MKQRIDFQTCKIASPTGAEDGRLARVGETIVAMLVRLAHAEGPGEWYLVLGFGPWEQEGLLFPTLQHAAEWIEQNLPQQWEASTCRDEIEAV
jgi:hypothetical protein